MEITSKYIFMKKFFLILICIFFYYSSLAQTDYYKDSIVYENMGSKLILYNDDTFVFKNKGVDIWKIQGIGDDTISYGKYVQYKNESLFLYSHPDIKRSHMEIGVKEEMIKETDSIVTIIMSSPFSKQKQLYPHLLKDAYFYLVEMSFVENKGNMAHKFSQIFFTDTILMKNNHGCALKEVSIRIYPYKSFSPGTPYYSYLSLNYTLKSESSNLLRIYIPKFTAYYINYDRFYGKEVEIIDSCTLGIDKKFLLSKCQGKSFNEYWEFIIHQLRNPYEFDEWGNEIETY